MIVKEEVLIDEVVHDGDEIDQCEGHLNLVDWMTDSIVPENLQQEENIERNANCKNGSSYGSPQIVSTLLYIQMHHFIRIYLHMRIAVAVVTWE